jgi:hypothetical protein
MSGNLIACVLKWSAAFALAVCCSASLFCTRLASADPADVVTINFSGSSICNAPSPFSGSVFRDRFCDRYVSS